MIEIPDLDQLSLGPSSQFVEQAQNEEIENSLPPSNPSALAYMIDSSNVSTNNASDDYLNDLRAYKFGQSSGFASERLLPQFQPPQVQQHSGFSQHRIHDLPVESTSQISLGGEGEYELNTAQTMSITQSPQPKFLHSPNPNPNTNLSAHNNDVIDLQDVQEEVASGSVDATKTSELVIPEESLASAGVVEHAAIVEQQILEREQEQEQRELAGPIQFTPNPARKVSIDDHPVPMNYGMTPQLPPPGSTVDIIKPILSPTEKSKTDASSGASASASAGPGPTITDASSSHPSHSINFSNPRLTLSNGEELSSIRKELATELKTPTEYTLHILFTQFVRHAERKLNLCLDFPINEEPQIIDLLADGVDPQFDKIIASLGYIARKKPSPVIDSVMFWRKSKSEVASMAALEVEKAILSARQHGHTVNQNSIANQNTTYNNNQGYPAPQIPPVKAKRSLSLMRSKSISKITGGHKRNQSASSNLTTATTNLNNMTSLNSQISQEGSYIEAQIYQARETAIQADRKSLALIYILCRVLIEVVKQTSTEVMGEELGSKLEEIVYTQMKTTDPISTSESIVRSANWNLFAQLLGFMSEKQFVGVSDRFIADLEKIPSHITNDMEPKLHLLIHGMKYLTLTNYPLEKFEELAEFMQSLGKFFSKSMNESIIYAYCEVMSELVLPLANILTAETNHPTWVEAIETIFNKAFQIWNHNMKYQQNDAAISSSHPTGWSHSIGLMTSMLSVSRKELFSKAWFEVVEENLFKLKPKVDAFEKTHFITCVTRLVWVYLYRLPDSLNNTVKRLDSLFGHLFFNASITGKKLQWINTTNSGLIASLATLMRIVGYQHLNYMLDNVIIRLLKLCFNGFSLENVSCERLILVVKSYLAIIRSYERGIKPTFPHDSKKMTSKTVPSSTFDGGVDDFLFIAKNSNNSISHEEICKSLGNLLRLLDGQYGADIWTPELLTPVTAPVSKVPQTGPLNDVNSASGGASNSGSGGGFFHFGGLASDSSSKQLQVELFATIIDAIPWTLVPLGGDKVAACGIPFKSIVEILARNAVHKNLAVATAAKNSLKKLATRKNPSSLITIFAKIAFQLSEKPGPNYNSVYLNSPEFHRLLKIYVELLNCWLGQFNYINEKQSSNKTVNPLSQDDEMMNKDVLNDLYQINYKTDDLSNAENINKLKPSDELEWKNIITVIEEVEGNGLFFLCSQDSKTRHFGIYILKLVEQFDQEIFNITDTNSAPAKSKLLSPNGSKSHSRSSSKFAADIGTRLIHLLEDTDFLELIKPFKNEISIPERNRLSKLKNKKNILVKLAESDYGIDSTLWFRLFPKMLEIFFDRCPMPVALCRSVVCVRMVQMHEFILDFADTQKNYTSSLFSRSNNNYGGAPPEVLVNQWKLYLIFAACSLTTTGEQKISFPNQPTHGRKKSMQMYIQHQKITSAKSVFRMVFPLLKSKQPKVKDAVIQGLSCININIMESFLENMPSSLSDWTSSTGAGLFKKRDADEDRLRIETIHILSNVTHRFQNKIEEIYCDEWIVANLVTLIKNVKVFLSTPEVQTDLEFQKLRRYFCQLLENVFVGIKEASSNDLNRWLPFEARLGCFNFLKEWCGYGDVADIADDRYTTMMSKIANLKGELQQTTLAAAILEVERKALQIAALSCMSKLCSGPIRHEIEVPGQNAVLSFDIPGLQSWIHGLFSTDIEYCHEIGKQALRNILKMNPDNSEIYESVCHECITSQEGSRATESYFTVFVEVYIEKEKETEVEQGTRENEQEQESQLVLDDTLPYKVICLASLLVGNENYEVRFAAIKLLSFLELKYYNSYFIEKYVECVRSKTKVIYKKALFDISVALANEHPEEHSKEFLT